MQVVQAQAYTSLLVFGGNIPGQTGAYRILGWSSSGLNEMIYPQQERVTVVFWNIDYKCLYMRDGQDATTVHCGIRRIYVLQEQQLPLQNLGQVFYNSTSNAFKVTQQPVPWWNLG
jgi:hypothetical protein